MRYEAHKNGFIEKIREIFAPWIDFTLARFDRSALSIRKQVASFYAESNGIFGYTKKVNFPYEKRFGHFVRS